MPDRFHSLLIKDDQPRVTVTIPEFQKFLFERIQAHADRVESFGLAAGRLVQEDIEQAISDIWKSLPDGFGAKLLNREPQRVSPILYKYTK